MKRKKTIPMMKGKDLENIDQELTEALHMLDGVNQKVQEILEQHKSEMPKETENEVTSEENSN